MIKTRKAGASRSELDVVDIRAELELEANNYKDQHNVISTYRVPLWRAHVIFIKEFKEFLDRKYLSKGITHLPKVEYDIHSNRVWTKAKQEVGIRYPGRTRPVDLRM